ncbi:MAG: hypothetical protein ACJ8EA_16195 [Xanthobacteraceae bacterium]
MDSNHLSSHRSIDIGLVGHRVWIAIVSALAIFLFAATFRAGLDRGMDHLVGWQASARVANAIAGVMTEDTFGQGRYAVSECAFGLLNTHGFIGNPDVAARLGVTVPESLKSGALLDHALERARRELPMLGEHCKAKTHIRGIGYDDLGYVDFAKLAFSLFGVHVRALYYLFFAIYGLTLGLALIERRSDLTGSLVLVSVAALIYATCYYAGFLDPSSNSVMGNMLDPRFIAVLGLIPTVHVLLMLVNRASPTWWRVAIVLFQSGVIFFAIHMRATGVWLATTIILAAVVVGLFSARTLKRASASWMAVAVRSVAGCWPAWTAVAVIFAGMFVVNMSLHPTYRENGWSTHHLMWFAVYASLQINPRWVNAGYFAAHENATGDAMPSAAARAYVKEHPEEDRPENYLGGTGFKLVALERLCRLAFFQFVRRDPWFVFETFVIVKGRLFFKDLIEQTRLAWSNSGFARRGAFVLALFAIGVIAAARPAALRRLSLFTSVFATGATASLAIPLLTIVGEPYTLAEEIMALQITGMLLFSLAVGYSTMFVRRTFGAPTAEPAPQYQLGARAQPGS